MIDREKIRDIMQNSSEGQYKLLIRYSINGISFKQINSYRIAYRYDEDYCTITEMIFLSEEEESHLFSTKRFPYCWCTPELGKYYLNKHSFYMR